MHYPASGRTGVGGRGLKSYDVTESVIFPSARQSRSVANVRLYMVHSLTHIMKAGCLYGWLDCVGPTQSNHHCRLLPAKLYHPLTNRYSGLLISITVTEQWSVEEGESVWGFGLLTHL